MSIFFGGVISEYIICQIDTEYAESIAELKNIYVYKTRTGERYHRSYHYSDRNYKLSLYSALKQDLTPCQVCNPSSRILPQKGYLWIIYIPVRILISMAPFALVYLLLNIKRKYSINEKMENNSENI